MTIRDDRRSAALEHMADHLLRGGLGGSSLRSLAAAAGTSDRMLLYYFAGKDELLAATLTHVAGRLAGILAEFGPQAPLPYGALLEGVLPILRTPLLQPYMRLWLELAAVAARGQEPHRTVAGQIADGFVAWLAARLDVPDEAERLPQAALLLATVDGLALLDGVGRSALVDAASGSNRP